MKNILRARTHSGDGFTLIELLVVIAIIAILAALAVPQISAALVKGQLVQTLSNARQIQIATLRMTTDATVTMLERWEDLADTGRVVDMTEEMGSLTMTITARALFGSDIAEDVEEIGRRIAVGLAIQGRVHAVADGRKYDYGAEGLQSVHDRPP